MGLHMQPNVNPKDTLLSIPQQLLLFTSTSQSIKSPFPPSTCLYPSQYPPHEAIRSFLLSSRRTSCSDLSQKRTRSVFSGDVEGYLKRDEHRIMTNSKTYHLSRLSEDGMKGWADLSFHRLHVHLPLPAYGVALSISYKKVGNWWGLPIGRVVCSINQSSIVSPQPCSLPTPQGSHAERWKLNQHWALLNRTIPEKQCSVVERKDYLMVEDNEARGELEEESRIETNKNRLREYRQ